MTTLTKPQNTDTENQKVLDRLARVVRRADDFVLGFVKCNHLPQQDEMRQALLSRLADTQVLEILLDAPIVSLLDEIAARWDADNPPDVVCVYGLRHSIRDEASPVLGRLNNDRELIRRAIPVPLLIWLPDFALDLVVQGAPDFWAWRSGVYEFQTDQALWEADSLLATTASSSSALASLSLQEKHAEIKRLEELLRTAQNFHRKGSRDQAILSSLWFRLGLMYYVLNQVEEAQMHFKKSLKVCEELGDQNGIAAALGSLGNIAYEQNDPVTAQEFFKKSLAISRETQSSLSVATTLRNLGSIAFVLGDLEAAYPLIEESLTISRQIRNLGGVANSLSTLGIITYVSGDPKSARSFIEESLAISRETGDRRSAASTLISLGNIAHEQGDHEAAMTFFEESLTINQEIGNRRSAAGTLNNMGLVLIDQGRSREALYAFLDAVQLFQELRLADNVGRFRQNIQHLREQVGEERFQTWVREKGSVKEAHWITVELDKEAAEIAVAA